MSTTRRQGFLCRRTASTEHAADTAEPAVASRPTVFVASLNIAMHSSLRPDSGTQTGDCFPMRRLHRPSLPIRTSPCSASYVSCQRGTARIC